MAQTDERRVENPQRLARYQLQRPLFMQSSHEFQLVSAWQTNKSAASTSDNSDGLKSGATFQLRH
jgi:hypothetical protein